jgi:hypothetical protein
MREKHLPRPYGLIELPTLDHILSFHLCTSRELRFA